MIDFNLADIGEGIAECEVLRWFVAPGDLIAQFDKVCEVQSDKANVEITSRYDGRVKELKYKVGELAKVGAPLLTIQLTGADTPSAAAPKDFPTPVLPPGIPPTEENLLAAGYPLSSVPSHRLSSLDEAELTAPHPDDGHASAETVELGISRVQTSPAVRRMAKEDRVDLTRVKGTGPQGRILKEDVQRYSQARGPGRASPSSPPSFTASPSYTPPAAERSAPAAAAPSRPLAAPTAAAEGFLGEDRTLAISGLQRIMVQTMTQANLVPHFTYGEEIDLSALASLRESLKPLFADLGLKVSFMPFFIKALSLALRSFPQINAHVNADCTSITHRASHNVGVAMDTPKGLLVPNVKRVQDRSVVDIARELGRLQGLGKAGQLTREDLQGGTITLSNIGSVGGTYCSPILVVPEVAICALGSMRVLPRFDGAGQVKAVKVMNITWSGDHRVVDGATIARFNEMWKGYIEQPSRMIVELR